MTFVVYLCPIWAIECVSFSPQIEQVLVSSPSEVQVADFSVIQSLNLCPEAFTYASLYSLLHTEHLFRV